MAGKVLRISKKGVIFKTYEGKINLETLAPSMVPARLQNRLIFPVEGDEEALIKKLEEVSLSGERINLHFVKRYAIFPGEAIQNTLLLLLSRLRIQSPSNYFCFRYDLSKPFISLTTLSNSTVASRI
jgi:hypothetical protein